MRPLRPQIALAIGALSVLAGMMLWTSSAVEYVDSVITGIVLLSKDIINLDKDKSEPNLVGEDEGGKKWKGFLTLKR